MNIQPRRMRALALSVLVWSGLAAAQPGPAAGPDPSGTIDLPGAIRLALGQPGIRAAAQEVAATEADASQAGRLPNPELDYLREGQGSGARTTTVQVRQQIELGGKRQARVALAGSASELARGELARLRQERRADVVAAFYALLVAQERRQLAQAANELARRSVDAAARRVQAGKISPLDETRARLAAVDAASEARRAATELALARTALAALTGVPAGSLVPVGQAAALPQLPPLPALVPAAGEGSAVRQARLRLFAQEAQTAVERAARMPDLTLVLGRQREQEQEAGFDARRSQTVVGLSLPLPLFNRNEGKLLAALRRTDKARDELAAAERDAAAALASAHARYELARGDAGMLRQEVVPSAQSAYELTLKGFEYGKFSFFDVLDAQRTLFQVQTRQCDALREAWQAYADIERLAGATESIDTSTLP